MYLSIALEGSQRGVCNQELSSEVPSEYGFVGIRVLVWEPRNMVTHRSMGEGSTRGLVDTQIWVSVLAGGYTTKVTQSGKILFFLRLEQPKGGSV